MKWETVRLGDYCSKIGSGATPKGGSNVYIDNGTSLVRSQNVYNLAFDYNGLVHITEEDAKKLSNVIIEENDVLLNITGDSVARTCIVPNDILPARVNQHVSIIRPEYKKLNFKYLSYYLASPYMQAYMLNLATGRGASRNALTKRMIEEFPVILPPINIQENIANVLSSYDDLVENNQRQIKLLEEAAMRLYKEWFVHFRFPGHEHTRIVDGVPKEWTTVYIGNLLAHEIGGGWGKETPQGRENIPAFVIRGTDIDLFLQGYMHSVPFRYHSESNLLSRALRDGDIIFEVSGGSKSTGVAKTLLIKKSMLDYMKTPVICASFCKLMRPIGEDFSYLLYTFLQHRRNTKETEKFEKRSASNIVNYRWKDFLSQQKILIPNKGILLNYNNIVESIYKKQIILSIQIEGAKKARDKLLPKLMNGEIEV